MAEDHVGKLHKVRDKLREERRQVIDTMLVATNASSFISEFLRIQTAIGNIELALTDEHEQVRAGHGAGSFGTEV
ncbi:hypothetical protein GOFOIKOB_1726 [Methylobacterium tardum]|jgi:hypothetical protein|uniref:Uncharacterized protein n=1 Tax=Methylobacterium tardum TaxID=374432 RepID=A0AA37WSX3_9HYPH|nr:hypothetical protein [Methylobacterium tardum]URD39652.1 hypothetical protein M6G65_15425 [Methylobacterium tardum]GJE48694.1 hypothetical protein GOFOIKOB_1726 [Methylobacterium tardum]GLS72415.1 hypothetical protein GCM10007890_44300 [Methylobacterium tardum]